MAARVCLEHLGTIDDGFDWASKAVERSKSEQSSLSSRCVPMYFSMDEPSTKWSTRLESKNLSTRSNENLYWNLPKHWFSPVRVSWGDLFWSYACLWLIQCHWCCLAGVCCLRGWRVSSSGVRIGSVRQSRTGWNSVWRRWRARWNATPTTTWCTFTWRWRTPYAARSAKRWSRCRRRCACGPNTCRRWSYWRCCCPRRPLRRRARRAPVVVTTATLSRPTTWRPASVTERWRWSRPHWTSTRRILTCFTSRA